jgi:hypothetical protein
MRGIAAVEGVITAGIISFILGFSAFPTSSPLVTFAQQNKLLALIIFIVLLTMTLLALRFASDSSKNSQGTAQTSPDHSSTANTMPFHSSTPSLPKLEMNRIAIALTTSTVSFVSLVSLLTIIVVRPTWCQNTFLCHTTYIAVPKTAASGVHDTNLDIYPIGIQTPYSLIQGDVAQYSLNHLPQITPVNFIGTSVASLPIRFAVGFHSLVGHGTIKLDALGINIEQAISSSHMYNVWQPSPTLYNTNIFSAHYIEELAGESLSTMPYPDPNFTLQLLPNEADVVDIEVSSPSAIDLRFSVVATYHIIGEAIRHSLELRNETFEVVFVDRSNWHLYQLTANGFAPLH